MSFERKAVPTVGDKLPAKLKPQRVVVEFPRMQFGQVYEVLSSSNLDRLAWGKELAPPQCHPPFLK